jgi:MSHA pilin protein MshD
MLTRQRGATLIELVMAIVVFSIALITLIVLTSQSTGRSADPMIQEQAVAIAQAYLEEISQKEFCDPDYDTDSNPLTRDCPTSCTGSVCQAGGCRNNGSSQEATRDLYDDICDYNGLSNNGAVDQNGDPVNGLSQYHVSVQVEDDNTVDINGLTGDTGKAALITVTVTHPAMPDAVKLSAFRTNY